jgi:hypothetical protein
MSWMPTGAGKGFDMYGPWPPGRRLEPTTPVPLPPLIPVRPLTPEEQQALRRIHRLKVVNVLLLFPLAFFVYWFISLAASPLYANYWGWKIMTSAVALLILALVIRNSRVRRRLKRK